MTYEEFSSQVLNELLENGVTIPDKVVEDMWKEGLTVEQAVLRFYDKEETDE